MNIFKNCFLILMVSSSLLLSGCEMISAQEYNKAENFSADIGVTGSESAVEEETAISDITNKTVGIVEGYPDFNKINQITIGDKTVSLPFKVEELGNQFCIDEYTDEYGNQSGELCLSYNNICIFWIRMNEESEINEIILIEPQLSNLSNLNMYWNIAGIDNINIENAVLDSFGSPTTILGKSENSLNGTYWYNMDLGNMCLSIVDNKLYSISISLY